MKITIGELLRELNKYDENLNIEIAINTSNDRYPFYVELENRDVAGGIICSSLQGNVVRLYSSINDKKYNLKIKEIF